MSWALALLLLPQAVPQGAAPRTIAIDPWRADASFEISGHQIRDLDGDGRAEFVVLARDGRVRSFQPLSTEPARARGELVLGAPERSLVELASFGGKSYLIALCPAGTLAYPLDAEGVVGAEASPWIPRARFGLRLGAPAFAPFLQDVNQDGVLDVVVPTLAGLELYLAKLEPAKLEPERAAPSFRKAATIAVELARSTEHEGGALSDSLSASLRIPGLDTSDVNGDGRADLVVRKDERRAWHLQRADASFPLEPDVSLDLSIFRDTTPAAEISFGSTLAVGDEASFQSRDLDGDALPDYVISHRRKVWVFRGGAAGPQFTEPSAILKTAEDITFLLATPLDDDALADLLLVKVQVPTLATLLRGLFGEWDVQIRALGYRNTGAGTFETSPGLTSELALRLPGIVGLMKNPEELVGRFEELQQRFRGGARGDVDGDGAEDTMLVTPDGKALELWAGSPADTRMDEQRWLRTLFFDDPERVWDIERALTTLGSLAERQVASATGGRPPDRSIPLRDPAGNEVLGLECADFDADGAREVVITYRSLTDAHAGGFDVVRFGRR
jgi:hypothetical protein